ncbi:MAG: glycosyltransferase family 4 protein [Anaerolineae bacterium]
MALVVPGLQYGGGVPSVALFLYRLLESTGRHEPSLISLSIASNDALSVRLLDPVTWKRGPQVSVGTWRGLAVTHVGAFLTELEFQRFRPRRALTRILDSFDLVQVVSGTPAMGLTVADLQQPRCLFAATTVRRERTSLLAASSGLRGLWLRLMTAVNAWSEPRALRLADHVFALSEYTRDQLSAMVPEARLSLGWVGVDTGLFYPAAAPAGKGYILSVGRLGDPRKNVRLLLEAYRILRERSPETPRLLLVGEHPPVKDWADAVRWGIAGSIDVRVNVEAKILPDLYRQASLFVLSSNEEGLGIVLLEAMASGLPVVSTDCGGPATCVVEGVTGYLTPIGDAEALANRMQALLADDALRQRMGQAGRRLAESRFSISAAGAPFLEVYDRLLDGCGGP